MVNDRTGIVPETRKHSPGRKGINSKANINAALLQRELHFCSGSCTSAAKAALLPQKLCALCLGGCNFAALAALLQLWLPSTFASLAALLPRLLHFCGSHSLLCFSFQYFSSNVSTRSPELHHSGSRKSLPAVEKPPSLSQEHRLVHIFDITALAHPRKHS